MHLRRPGFKSSACRPFPESTEEIQKTKEKRDSRYIYPKKLGKSSIQHVMAYGDFKDLPRRIPYNKVLRDKVFNIAKNPNCDGNLVSMDYKFFDKKSALLTDKFHSSDDVKQRIN